MYTKKNKGKKNRSEGSNGLIRFENCQLELNELFGYTKLSQLRMTMPLPCHSHFAPESLRLTRSYLRKTMCATGLQSLLRVSANKIAASIGYTTGQMHSPFSKTEKKN